MATPENAVVENRSGLREFLASIATATGDLSNITAPPSVLDTKSVVEVPAFWAESPAIFVSPSKSENPAQRALLILRSFLSCLKSQAYLGHSPDSGVKKPLNAFLGELFIGKWEDDHGTTRVVSEQVSHHPPITACRVWNDKYGVIGEGYNRQTITFNGSVNVQCTGHILQSLTKYNEHYLLPIPDLKVKNVLGTPYPEIDGTYYIPGSNGYTSSIHFSGKSFFGTSKKHAFTAHLYKAEDGESKALFTAEGHWDKKFTIRDNVKGEDVETFDVESHMKKLPPLLVDSVEEQDPWESRNAWKDTITAQREGDMKGISDAKSRLEEGQRKMREDEEKQGKEWEPLFFRQSSNDKIIEQLNAKVPNEDYQKSKAETEGIWKFVPEAWKSIKRPYHGHLRPDNSSVGQTHTSETKPKQSSESSESKNQASLAFRDHQQHNNQPVSDETNHTVGAVRNRISAEFNDTQRRIPEANVSENIAKYQTRPQTAQTDVVKDHSGTGVGGMSAIEKALIENMMRDQFSTASQERRSARAKRRSVDHK